MRVRPDRAASDVARAATHLAIVFDPKIEIEPEYCGGGQRIGLELARVLANHIPVSALGVAGSPSTRFRGGAHLRLTSREQYRDEFLTVTSRTSHLLAINWLPSAELLAGTPTAVLYCHYREPAEWGLTTDHRDCVTLWCFHSRWLADDFGEVHPGLVRLALPVGLPDRANPAPRSPSTSSRMVLGYAGAFLEEKGLGDLLEAATTMWASGDSFQLRLAGDAALWGTDFGNPISIDGSRDFVDYRGRLNYADMSDFWRSVDVCVMPSRLDECLPLTVIEAVANGCRVIATNSPGNRELLAEKPYGRIVPKADPPSLTEAIRASLSEPQPSQFELGTVPALTWSQGAHMLLERFIDASTDADRGDP